MSLPEWRMLAGGEIYERPVFGSHHQFFPHGIFQDVIGLFTAAFFLSQPMLKEIPLPANAESFCRPFLPFADDMFDRFARRRKRNQGMEMVGHQQKNMRPPQSLILPVTDGFKERRRSFFDGQLVGSAQFTIDGDKINLPLRINPQRDCVRQGFSAGNVHGESIGPEEIRRNV